MHVWTCAGSGEFMQYIACTYRNVSADLGEKRSVRVLIRMRAISGSSALGSLGRRAPMGHAQRNGNAYMHTCTTTFTHTHTSHAHAHANAPYCGCATEHWPASRAPGV